MKNKNRIKEALVLCRTTPSKLAKILFVARSTIHGWISGKHRPSEIMCSRVAAVLGVDASWLWHDEILPEFYRSIARRVLFQTEKLQRDELEKLLWWLSYELHDKEKELSHRLNSLAQAIKELSS